MDLEDAMAKALQILGEERVRPTIRYTENLPSVAGESLMERASAALAHRSRPNLDAIRNSRPRPVSESPDLYLFGGTNFDLLLAVFRQLPEGLRPGFISYLLRFVEQGVANSRTNRTTHFPTFEGRVSDLPLIAEFCIRTGHLQELLASAQKIKSATIGLVLMLMQLEELISLNFNVLSEHDLRLVIKETRPIGEMAENFSKTLSGPRGRAKKHNPNFRPGREKEARSILASLEEIEAECRQANYFYVKHSIQQNRRLEIESDRIKVVSSLRHLGFSRTLEQALEEAEKEYREGATGFRLKNCLTHLRSFLEELHAQGCKAIAGPTTPDTEYNRWGLTLAFLRKWSYLSSQEEKLVGGLHSIMSEDGVHPLIAEPEYVRLMRNMTIEYGLLFLSILEKKGIRISS